MRVVPTQKKREAPPLMFNVCEANYRLRYNLAGINLRLTLAGINGSKRNSCQRFCYQNTFSVQAKVLAILVHFWCYHFLCIDISLRNDPPEKISHITK